MNTQTHIVKNEMEIFFYAIPTNDSYARVAVAAFVAHLNHSLEELAGNYYSDGFAAYRSEDFTTAIELLSKAVYYDATSADALYYLGQAYRKNDDREKAIATFEKVIELFPDTQNATNAQRNIGELNQSAN